MKKLGVFKEIRKAKWIYIGLFPTFFLLGLFSLYPAINAIIKSFYYWKMNNLSNTRFIGLENYVKLMGDGQFWGSFINLLIFIVFGFFTTFFILMPVTYLVYKMGQTIAGKLFRRLYVFPMMVPVMVGILFWRFFYDYYFGMLNSFLNSIGMPEYMHVWLGEKATALPSILFVGFPWIGGFAFLILLAAFQAIDESLHEAADLDGANSFDMFLKIDLPIIIPQAKILIILGMIGGVQQFALQMIMTNGGPENSTSVPGLLMYKTAINLGNLGYGSTMGVALFILILAITIINNKIIKGRE